MTPTRFTLFRFLANALHVLRRTCILDLKAVAIMRRTFELRAVALAHSESTVRIQRPVFRVVIAMICLRMRAFVHTKLNPRASKWPCLRVCVWILRIVLVYARRKGLQTDLSLIMTCLSRIMRNLVAKSVAAWAHSRRNRRNAFHRLPK